MKFKDKFSNMIPIVDESHGIMRGRKKGHCGYCGTLTDFIDIDAEAYFCSEECMQKFYAELWEGPNEI